MRLFVASKYSIPTSDSLGKRKAIEMEGPIFIGEGDAISLVDTTGDFYPEFGSYSPGAFPVTDAHLCIPVLNQVLPLPWALRVLGFDKHPAEHVSFKEFPSHCVAGTPGSKLHPAIKPGPFDGKPNGWFDLLVPKGTNPLIDAFSLFFDQQGNPIGKGKGKLRKKLKRLKIRRHFVVGNEAIHCVGDTVRHSCRLGGELGWETYVIRDAVGSFTGRTGQYAFEAMERWRAHIVSSHQLDVA